MSFDDYAQHLAQKYRLAISIAILNIKPSDLTIDEFLGQIRSTIEQNAENIDNDFNISACSDDFIDSSDDVNDPDQIINQKEPQDHNIHQNHIKESEQHTDFDQQNQKLHEHTDFNDQTYMNQNIHDFNVENNGFDNKIEGIVVTESQDNAAMKITDERHNNGINTSNVLNKDLDGANKRREKFREIIKVLKGNDVASDKVVRDDSQPTFKNSFQTFDLIDLTQCDDFSITQNTLNNSISEFNQNVHNKNLKILGDKDLNHTRDTNDIRKRMQNELCERESKITKNDSAFNSKEINSNENVTPKNIEINKDFEMNMDEKSLGNDSNNLHSKATNNNQGQIAPVIIDTQETIYTQTNTQYSPSQMNEVIVNTQFIHGNKNTKDSNKSMSKKAIGRSETQNYPKNPVDLNKRHENPDLLKHKTNNEINNFKEHTSLQDNVYKDQIERNTIENDTAYQNMDLDIQPFNNAFENCTSFGETNTDRSDTGTLTNEKGSTVFDKTSSEIETDGKEKIPFKIIEDMNRIKVYLKRKENNDLSSGYRSSQTQSSFGGTPQYLWIGQSANNIFNYLTNCLLITSTHLLTEQMSETLGLLIDRLHADESYPAFLEDLLTTVDCTLLLIYEEDNYLFHVGQKKDEQMQRLLLLNKSTHVQRYTIDKINKILQKLFDNLSADDTIEIQSIDKIENLCYIFHILQVLLPKYSVDQSITHNSNTILRKNDITDIWRRKWIEQKIDKNEGSSENKCVLKECSDLLNKIIVHFMDGYPLIAFSALNCFNLIQT